MAIYHFSASIVKRSAGHSAVAGAAYISGTSIHEERTGLTHDYTRRRGVVQSEILAPALAHRWMYDRAELWNQVEQGERRQDAQIARSIRLALPHELTDEQRADLVFEYAREMFVSQGMIADIAIHRPDHHGDERNHHAHILLTMREIEGDGFCRKKQREWNDEALLDHWREAWAEYQNAALEKYGHSARVDHRTLEAQGIDREPTRHLGKDASAMERDGIPSRIGDENREIAERNQERALLDQLVAELAAVEAEIAEELAKAGTEREPEPETPLAFPTAQEQPAPQSVGRAAVNETNVPWEQWQAKRQSALSSEVTRAYREEEPPTPEQEQEQSERRWYENVLTVGEHLYARTREAISDVWQRYVGGRDKDEPERERDGPEPER